MPYRVLVFVILGLAFGCEQRNRNAPGSGAAPAKLVTLTELEKETEHLVFLSFIGSDEEFHYFVTPDRKRYKVERREWELPPHMVASMPNVGEVALFVKVKDGKVTLPDPKKMAELTPDQLIQGKP